MYTNALPTPTPTEIGPEASAKLPDPIYNNLDHMQMYGTAAVGLAMDRVSTTTESMVSSVASAATTATERVTDALSTAKASTANLLRGHKRTLAVLGSTSVAALFGTALTGTAVSQEGSSGDTPAQTAEDDGTARASRLIKRCLTKDISINPFAALKPKFPMRRKNVNGTLIVNKFKGENSEDKLRFRWSYRKARTYCGMIAVSKNGIMTFPSPTKSTSKKTTHGITRGGYYDVSIPGDNASPEEKDKGLSTFILLFKKR